MKFLSLIMITCVKATELIEKRQIQSLTIAEWLKLRLHVSLCEACEAYQRQSKTIEKVISQWISRTEHKSPQLSQQKKDEIAEKIKKL